MTVIEVEKWFRTLNRACVALDLAPQNATHWRTQGYIPWKQQFRIAVYTDGELMPDDEDPYLVLNPRPPRVRKTKKSKSAQPELRAE